MFTCWLILRSASTLGATCQKSSRIEVFCDAQSLYQTASENYQNKQGTVSQIITDPSTHEIKPNMFSSLPIMEMDNLTERTITDDVIQNLYLIFFLTSQASNFIYTAVYL